MSIDTKALRELVADLRAATRTNRAAGEPGMRVLGWVVPCEDRPMAFRLDDLGKLLDAADRLAEVEAENSKLKASLERQGKAALAGMDAAKAGASLMLEQARKLSAESRPEVVESERDANALLTAEVERLESELAELRTLYDVASERVGLLTDERRELREALEHERRCRTCAEDGCDNCSGCTAKTALAAGGEK